MRRFLSFIIKPQGGAIKWLLLIIVAIVVGLGSLGYLDQVIDFLDSDELTFKFGKKTSFSVYWILKSASVVIGIFWITGMISDYAQQYIRHITTIKSSNRAILSKAIQIIIYFIAFLMLMDFLEIDLKSLTIFSGAVGIGVGFGLQKITSNFISGLILLFEKSVRVDDLIELDGGLSGIIKYTGARYTLVEAMDGREVMIPNEDLITGKVTNWTYSHNKARVEISLGVAYDSDLELVKTLMLEAASESSKCLYDPKPNCFVRKFADNSIEFTLFFWISDIIDGRLQPQSDVMMNIWKKFKERGISIPSPQREVFVRNFAELKEIKPKEI